MSSAKKRQLSVVLLCLLVGTETVGAEGPAPTDEYRELPGVGSRLAMWRTAQLHLMFAAFVLAVPMFVLHSSFAAHIQQMRGCRHNATCHSYRMRSYENSRSFHGNV